MKTVILFLSILLNVLLCTAQRPQFDWARGMGGKNLDRCIASAIDNDGNIFTGGVFADTSDFDPGPGVFNLSNASKSGDIYVCKLDKNGMFQWAKRIGDIEFENLWGMGTDADGNVYCTGEFVLKVDFDPGPGVFELYAPSGGAFILKLDKNGTFVWAKCISRTDSTTWGSCRGTSLSIDNKGNICVAGFLRGVVDADPGPGISKIGNKDDFSGFAVKLRPSGDFVWGKCFQKITNSMLEPGIKTDHESNVYLFGNFTGAMDFDPGGDKYSMTATGDVDGFLCKLDSNGTFVWAKRVGSTARDDIKGVDVDQQGNVYAAGLYSNTVDFDPGPSEFLLTTPYREMPFLWKLDKEGNFLWVKSTTGLDAKSMGGCKSLTLDKWGELIMSGYVFYGMDFDPDTAKALSDIYSGNFIWSLDTAGQYKWSSFFSNGSPNNILFDKDASVIATGYFMRKADCDPGPDTAYLQSVDNSEDVLVIKLSRTGLAIGDIKSPDNYPLSIFPNPGSGSFNLKFPSNHSGRKVSIYNNLGAMILSFEAKLELETFNLDNQAPGIYLVKIIDPVNGWSQIKKIVKL